MLPKPVLYKKQRQKEVRRIRRRASNYVYSDKQIYLKPTKRHPQERLVPPPDHRQRIIDEVHDDMGHLGVTKVCSIITARYYWRRMSRDVKNMLKVCESYLKHNTRFNKEPQALRPLPLQGLFDRVSLDFMGPFPRTRKGNQFVIVGVDSNSKWIEARATSTRSAEVATQFFLNEYIARGITPKVVLTDGGGEFMREFDEMLLGNGIVHRRSSANHPSTNGLAEKVVQNLLHAFQKTIGNHPQVWDEHLPMILIGQRAARHESTGFSPYYLVYGRHPTLPVERRIEASLFPRAEAPPPVKRKLPQVKPEPTPPASPAKQEQDEVSVIVISSSSSDEPPEKRLKTEIEACVNAREQAAAQAEQNMLRAQQKQCIDHRRRRRVSLSSDSMHVGSLVLMESPRSTRGNKLGPRAESPYQLVSYNEDFSRAVLEDAKQKRWSIHVSRISSYKAG